MDNKKSSILIVDDQQLGRQLLESILYKEDYQLFFAEDGVQAIEKAKKILPDVILLDVMMPKMDGFETTRQLRQDKNLENVPILLVTALDDRDSRLKGFEAGADDYISKPIDRLEVLTRIRTILRLNRFRLLREGQENGGENQIGNPLADAEQKQLIKQLAFDHRPKNDNCFVYFPADYISGSAINYLQGNTAASFFMQCGSASVGPALFAQILKQRIKDYLLNTPEKEYLSPEELLVSHLLLLREQLDLNDTDSEVLHAPFEFFFGIYDKTNGSLSFCGVNTTVFLLHENIITEFSTDKLEVNLKTFNPDQLMGNIRKLKEKTTMFVVPNSKLSVDKINFIKQIVSENASTEHISGKLSTNSIDLPVICLSI